MKNPLFDTENWREISVTLAQNKTRTLLTAFGIFWGTLMLALLMGGADALKRYMGRNFEGFATNAAVIFPGRTTVSHAGLNKGREIVLDLRDIDNLRRALPQIESSSQVLQRQASVYHGSRKSSGQLTGVEPGYSRIFEPVFNEGRFINPGDCSREAKVCVLGADIARELFGTAAALGKKVEIDGVFYTVAGVVSQIAEVNIGASMNQSIFLPATTMRRAYNLGDKVHVFMMTFVQGHRPAWSEPQLRRIIGAAHSIAPGDTGAVEFFKVSEMFEMVDNVFLAISLLALVVGAGTLLSGIIGVGNIMWIIVRERTREIGIRRALGARPRDIIVQVLCEAMALTALAGMAGITAAVLILAGADTLTAPPGSAPLGFQLTPGQAGGIMACFITLGAAAGTLPARKAMKIKPVEALNGK